MYHLPVVLAVLLNSPFDNVNAMPQLGCRILARRMKLGLQPQPGEVPGSGKGPAGSASFPRCNPYSPYTGKGENRNLALNLLLASRFPDGASVPPSF